MKKIECCLNNGEKRNKNCNNGMPLTTNETKKTTTTTATAALSTATTTTSPVAGSGNENLIKSKLCDAIKIPNTKCNVNAIETNCPQRNDIKQSSSGDSSSGAFCCGSNEVPLTLMAKNGCENIVHVHQHHHHHHQQCNTCNFKNEMENLDVSMKNNTMGPSAASASPSIPTTTSSATSSSSPIPLPPATSASTSSPIQPPPPSSSSSSLLCLKNKNPDKLNDMSNVITTTTCTNMPKAPEYKNTQIPTLKLKTNQTNILECTEQAKVVTAMPDERKETIAFSSLENTHAQHSSLDSGLMNESCSMPDKEISSKLQSIDSRPIYPNVPYSPYGSPHTNRRRPPLRESRRISIESRGSFLQLNQYKLMDQIGQGSYGLVKLAYSEEDSTHYAMKILSKRRLLRQAALMRRGPKKMATTSPLDRVYREIAVLKKLDHPNVVKLIEVLDDPVDDSLYLVFELVKHGEILGIPTNKPLNEERAWSVFRDTLLGLEYLHYQRIIHADLKPGNLLLTECGHVKIADLGVCNEFLGENATISNVSTASTPAFRAPETLQLGNHSYCGRASDIWALGATLYALVFGNVPFVANTIPVLYEKIKNDNLTFPEHISISDELKDCIERMLTKDPFKRITLPQLKEHSWVTMGGVHPLPTEEENCCLVQISEDDINSVVRSIPKLDTLILIKTMLKKHSFGNPFNKSVGSSGSGGGGVSGRAPQRGGSRLERFVRAGRSNSAPGAYNAAMDRQFSSENMLPSLSESGNPSTNADD